MGRLWSPGKYVSRPAWYDRGPTVTHAAWLGNDVAPHAYTTRWTYTVPAGRKAMLEVALVYVRRSLAATTVGWATARIQYTPAGGSANYLLLADTRSNTVDATESMSTGQSIVMNAGDALEGATSDSSTGGTCDFRVIVKITEFDA